MKRVVKIVLWSLLGVYLLVMVVYISTQSSSAVCKSVNVVIENSTDYGFLSPKEIENYIRLKFPRLVGAKVDKIQLEAIERFVKKIKTIQKCAVFQTKTGVLTISITQREPFLRIFASGRSYYIDDQGNDFPSTFRFASRVLVVNGSVNELSTYDDLIILAKFINGDSFWSAQIVQISVEPNGDFSLIPRVGDHVIVFGGIERMEEKFEVLKSFYANALKPQQWEDYKKINIKFEGQVVCTKKD